MTVQDSYKIDNLLRKGNFEAALKAIKKHYNAADLLGENDIPFINTNEHRVYLLADFSQILDVETLF